MRKRFSQFVANYKLVIMLWLCGLITILSVWLIVHRQIGLNATYYDNPHRQGPPVLSTTEKTPYLKGDTGSNLLGTNEYSATWSGWIFIPKSGTYRFATNSDDGSSLYLDNKLLVANGGVHGLQRVSQKIFLEEGAHPFELHYMQMGGLSVLETSWTPPGKDEQLLPPEVLFPEYPGWIDLTLRHTVLFFKELIFWQWSLLLFVLALLSVRTQLTFTEMWKRYITFTRRQKHSWTLESWILFGFILFLILTSALGFDFRTNPKTGDQASHFMQVLSLAYDGDLHYGEEDIIRWREVGWGDNPGYLFFKGYSKGYCFGKPYGYSLFLAPFVKLWGPIRGSMLGNSCLFMLLLFFSALLLRMKHQGSLLPMMLIGLYLASYAYFYIYVLHTELFLATLTAIYFYLLFRYLHTNSLWFLAGASILLAFGTSEKIQFLLLFSPGFIAALIQGKKYKQKLLLVPLLVLTLLLSISPYLFYSDFQDWNPYSGERYWSFILPFAPEYDAEQDGATVEARRLKTGRYFSPQYILKTAQKYIEKPKEFILSLYFYFVGAHTGVLVFVPLAAFLLFASMGPRHINWRSGAILLGILAYILFYVFLFPENYYGGAHSLGNRYFLQILPVMIALLITTRLDRRALWKSALIGIMMSLVFLWPHHKDPTQAYIKLKRTSWLQRCMPAEINQYNMGAFADRQDPINLHLVPWLPEWKYIENPDKHYLFVAGKLQKPEVVTPYYRRSYVKISKGMLFYQMFDEPQGNVYIGDGFRYPEKTHVWSYGEASIILEAFQNSKVCVSLKPRQSEGMLTLETEGHKERLKLPAIVCSGSEQHAEETFSYIKLTVDSGSAPSPDSLVFSLKWTDGEDWKATPAERIQDVSAASY